MLLRRCLRSVNHRRCLFSRTLSTDSPDNTSHDHVTVPPDDEGVNFVKKADVADTVVETATDAVLLQKKAYHEKCHAEMVENLNSLHSLVLNHRKSLSQQSMKERPIARNDFFNVKSLFTLRDLFDNRVHLGHHIGCWNSANKKYLYGIRNNMHVIDIASTEQHLWRALNCVSLLVYNGGRVMFVNNRQGYGKIVKTGAGSCGERYWTSTRRLGKYDELNLDWFDQEKPDLVICSSVNNPVSQQLLLHCNKYLIPSIGILDSDVDPTNLTYVIPGNDDSTQSVLFYHKVFAKAIQRAKAVRVALQNIEASNQVKHAR